MNRTNESYLASIPVELHFEQINLALRTSQQLWYTCNITVSEHLTPCNLHNWRGRGLKGERGGGGWQFMGLADVF